MSSRHSPPRRREDDRSRDKDSQRQRSRSRDRHGDEDHRKDRDGGKKRKRDKSEERRERKEEKKRLKADEDARQLAELSVYSATDNPFHDANLGQQFKWHKKAEKEKKSGISVAESQRRESARRLEAKEELERLNKKRAEREVEQQLREEEQTRMQRMAESSQMADWLAKDGDFQLEQERRRAGIRLKEKRAKAIDFLALNLKYASPVEAEDDGLGLEEAGLEIDLDEPYAIFENLNLEQTEELHDDIQRYLSLETSDVNIEFWTNMMVVCKDRLEKLSAGDRARKMAGTISTAHVAVESEISGLLSGKSYDQLGALQRQIQEKLSSGEPVDIEYWESLLKSLIVWKAKSKLKSLHEVVVRNRLEQLRKRQRDEAIQAQLELLAGVKHSHTTKGWGGDMHAEATNTDEPGSKVVEEPPEVYDRSMSPVLLDIRQLPYEDRQVEIIKPVDDMRALFALRRSVAASRYVAKTVQAVIEVPEDVEAQETRDMASEALYRMDAAQDLEEDEEVLNLEENVAVPMTYTWEDKYRPRKPRYFNRVHTGYEWNKYNQTHYDTDNPPPKVVQGYKFNIFYPDLIDKSKAPSYKIVREPGNEDTILLHFTAGPPYEDIAFRVVDREWEYSHKRGFRSSFDRGCLSLWFNFRRNFYRK